MPKYREVSCVGSQLAYHCQCCSVKKYGYDRSRHGCTMRLKWVAGALTPDLEVGKQQYYEKANSSMDCNAGMGFLLTATNRRTRNCLRLDAIFVTIPAVEELARGN